MANLRIVFDNAADRATLTATQTAGSLVVGNLKTDRKGQVWRSTTTTAAVDAVFPAAETLSCVAFPFSNLSPTATIRVQLYSDTGTVTQLYDSGNVLCCGNAALGIWDFNLMPTGANGYAYGGGSYGVVWFPERANVRHVVITITDTSNALGYVEAARLVIGKYWSPIVGADFGAELGMNDASKHDMNDAGDLITTRGSRRKTLALNLSFMQSAERTQLISIMRGNGMARPLFCSLFPASGDLDLEQAFSIYGKLSSMAGIKAARFNLFSGGINILEI